MPYIIDVTGMITLCTLHSYPENLLCKTASGLIIFLDGVLDLLEMRQVVQRTEFTFPVTAMLSGAWPHLSKVKVLLYTFYLISQNPFQFPY